MGAAIILLLVVLLICVAVYFFLSSMYAKAFGGHSQQDERSATYVYDHYAANYPRREVEFSGQAAQLHGFIYGEDNTNALVVFAHGIGSNHEGYLSTIIWLVDHGYRVFAPDLSGSGRSSGATTGLSQSAIDMDTVLSYIEADEELRKLPKVLMGHSWGSYGVGAVLNYGHDVKAVVNVAGYNDPVDMISFIFRLSLGKLGNLTKPFLRLHHRIHFGKAGLYRVVDGINKANIPVLIVQGAEDPINTPDGTGIYAYRDKIKNPFVEYMYIAKKDCANHGSAFHTEQANKMIAQVVKDMEQLKKDYTGDKLEQKLAEYHARIDKSLISSPNEDFLKKVDAFFQKAIAQ